MGGEQLVSRRVHVVDVATGQEYDRELTEEELRAREDTVPEEERAASEAGVLATLEARATQALQRNRQYLAQGGSPTASQLRAQVKSLTRQNNQIIRLLVRALDGTE